MRKLFLFLFAAMLCNVSMAQVKQSLKHVTVDIGMGSSPDGFYGTSRLIYLEPGYRFLGIFKAGVRFENNFANMKTMGSTAATLDVYYLGSKHLLRPFIGAAVAHYTTTEAAGCGGGPFLTYKTLRSTKPSGAMLRTGLEIAHFRMAIEYNFMADTYVTDVDNNEKAIATQVYKNGYFGFKAGVMIGGGKKKIKTN
jgi:hypothetical protein